MKSYVTWDNIEKGKSLLMNILREYRLVLYSAWSKKISIVLIPIKLRNVYNVGGILRNFKESAFITHKLKYYIIMHKERKM